MHQRCRRKWAFCPSGGSVPPRPSLHALVKGLSRPSYRNEDVGIQQRRHFSSCSSFLTRSVVIRGESGGTSKTAIPSTILKRAGPASPLRRSSETALQSDNDRLSA